MRTRRTILTLAAIALCAAATTADAQSNRDRRHPIHPPFPPPIPPRGWVEIETEVDGALDGSILRVNCAQTYRNHGRGLEEIEVLIPVPADAVITDGLLLADGREYRAEILDAKEARAIYEEIVRGRRDPALIEHAGRGLIRISAFPIPPGGERTVSFRYHQAVPAPSNRARMLLPIATFSGIDRSGPLSLRLSVRGSEPIAQIYSPTHEIDVRRLDRESAEILYVTPRSDPRDGLEMIVVRDGRSMGIDLRTARGEDRYDYFLLALSPGWDLLSQRRAARETQIFVLDVSGSMEGRKFDQAREALHRFLDELPREDRFNVIAFSDDVRPLFEDGPRRADPESIRRARAWIDRLRTGGGTAIDDAITEATLRRWEATLVLFLTDGLPTVGETDPRRIVRRVEQADDRLRFFAFGVGHDVDARLLDDLARAGRGSVIYVTPNEGIAEAVLALRRRVAHPCARDVRLDVRGASVREVFPEGSRDLFAGEPLLFAGRVRRGAGRATIELRARDPHGAPLRETWRVDFGDPDLRSSAVPVLWASRKAASLIDQIRREGGDPRALAELQELSKRYGILTEEVAMLAREDAPWLADRGRGGPATWGGGPVSPSSPQLQLRGSRRSAPSAGLSAGVDAQGGEIQLSAEAWRLSGVKSAKEAAEAKAIDRSVVAAAGKVFEQRDGVWIDRDLHDPLPAGTETIRVRAFGAAYFRLASEEPLREWLAVGTPARIHLPGILLEIGPDGEEDLPDATIRKILGVARQP